MNVFTRSDLNRNYGLLFSIRSTFTFIHSALDQMLLEDISVEPPSNGSDIDVQGILDGKRIVFQIKSLTSFLSDYNKVIDFWTKKFYDDILNRYGIFAKVIFTSSPQNSTTMSPYILERKKVSSSLEVSYGVLYFDIDSLQYPTLKRVKNATHKSYKQLRDSNAEYKIAVIDIRHEAINEETAYRYVRDIFLDKRYPESSL